MRVLLELAPVDVDVREVEARLGRLPGVASVHDLHVWTLTSGYRLASGHLVLRGDAELGAVLRQATDLLRDGFQIEHATLQSEPAGFAEPTTEV